MKAILDPDAVERMEIQLTRRDLRFGLLWRLGTVTGLRISDLLRLRRKDFRGMSLSVVEQKSGKPKTIQFDIATWMAIDTHFSACELQADDYIFYRRASTKQIPMSRQWARTVIAFTARSMGLESIGAHSMRKIYACDCYRASGSLEAVRAHLNHSKAETTLIYLKDILGASTGL